jgi:sugar (pentulose or hexulose) kinase
MDTNSKCAVVGIDVGTSGVRGVAVSPAGELLAEAEKKLREDYRAGGGIDEQDPNEWWRVLCSVGQTLVKPLKGKPRGGAVRRRGSPQGEHHE